jgi:hypothetical protein
LVRALIISVPVLPLVAAALFFASQEPWAAVAFGSPLLAGAAALWCANTARVVHIQSDGADGRRWIWFCSGLALSAFAWFALAITVLVPVIALKAVSSTAFAVGAGLVAISFISVAMQEGPWRQFRQVIDAASIALAVAAIVWAAGDFVPQPSEPDGMLGQAVRWGVPVGAAVLFPAACLAFGARGGGRAARPDGGRLLWTLAAFMLAVGVAAHCLDELHGRPLGTTLPSPALVAASAASLAGAAAIGLWGIGEVGPWLLPFVLAGVLLVVAYNLELLAGLFHTDVVFALAWGGFPVLVGGFAQTGALELPVVLGAGFATATSLAQRRLSNWARRMRRGGVRVDGVIQHAGAGPEPLETATLTMHAEAALRALAAAHVLLAAALVALRLT